MTGALLHLCERNHPQKLLWCLTFCVAPQSPAGPFAMIYNNNGSSLAEYQSSIPGQIKDPGAIFDDTIIYFISHTIEPEFENAITLIKSEFQVTFLIFVSNMARNLMRFRFRRDL